MDKSPDAFRTISEVAEVLDTPAHVLRFWESRFPQIKPVKRAGGRRYYRPSDVALLTGIKRLLHEEGLTIRGVQKILRDHGVRHVAGLTDDSGGIGTLTAPDPVDQDVASVPEDEVPEAGFIAIDDTEPEPVPEPVRSAPIRATGEQAILPLFDLPPALSRAESAASAAPAPARKPTQRSDTTFASLIRALPRGALVSCQPQLADLARRLVAHRARLAARAEGGGR